MNLFYFKSMCFVLTIFLCITTSCRQSSSKSTQDESLEKIAKPKVNLDFVKTFEGQINEKYDVIMKLTSNSGQITGTYFYKNVAESIELSGALNSDQSLTIYEYNRAGMQTGVFKGHLINGNKIEGSWTKANGSSSLPFYLIESNSQYESEKSSLQTQKYNRIAGNYENENNSDNYFGSAKFTNLGNGNFNFTVTVIKGASCSGEVTGQISLNDESKAYFSDENCETLEFKFSNDYVIIKEVSICDYHGANCTFNGKYRKK